MNWIGIHGRAKTGVFLCLMLALLGCEEFATTPFDPDAGAENSSSSVPPQPAPNSVALSNYYLEVQADLLSQGLLRSDVGSSEAPFGARELAENFARIALFDEYTLSGQRLIASPQPSRLRKWQGPVNISVEFGKTVPFAQRRKDMRNVTSYAARLSQLSGLPIRVGAPNPNFHVLILNEDERLAYGPRLKTLVPGITPAYARTITDMPRSRFCLVNAFAGPSDTAAISAAIAVIRGEHPDRLRLSCIHEELAQGLGLANDSPATRPSIFNDDEEFGLLTFHDELLLKILYSPRLTVGMDLEEAEPIIREVSGDLLGGS